MSFMIIGHVRSGSTLIYNTARKHLIEQNILSEDKAIGEFLIESPEIIVGEKDNKLWSKEIPLSPEKFNKKMSNSIPFSERKRLFLKHINEGYFLKSLSIDIATDSDLVFGIKNNYNHIIFIKRNDIMESVLSWVIAFHFKFFRENKHHPCYHEFYANPKTVIWALNTIRAQKHLIEYLKNNTLSIVEYENISNSNVSDILSNCGFYSEKLEFMDEIPSDKKMMYPVEKKNLLTNYEEIKTLVEKYILLHNL